MPSEQKWLPAALTRRRQPQTCPECRPALPRIALLTSLSIENCDQVNPLQRKPLIDKPTTRLTARKLIYEPFDTICQPFELCAAMPAMRSASHIPEAANPGETRRGAAPLPTARATFRVGGGGKARGGTKGTVVTRWNLIMVGALIGAVPILILYAAAQRYFVQGIALTGLKT